MSPVEDVQVWWDGMTPAQREAVAIAEGIPGKPEDWSRSWSDLPAAAQQLWISMAYDGIAGRDDCESGKQDSAA